MTETSPTPISSSATTDRFRAAVHRRDAAAMKDLFTEDIRFFSPVKFTPFEGRPMVMGLFEVLMRTFEEFRYVGEFTGTAGTKDDEDAPVPSAVLVFRATVGGKEIHGIDMLHFAEDGRIKEFTVMVRPMSAVQTLGEAVLAGLTTAGLIGGGQGQ